ncbi:hypothetical protein ACMDCR_09730 [Labrys okinawensis]|uniref:hypothetical protein n=1 Tax=Labrys okinawensis TaxID=346911 RepID=UPI0039BD1A8B
MSLKDEPLIDRQDPFLSEAQEVLRAGLASARWVSVDDTGARQKAKNGFCTQIGNDRFTWLGTTGSKSRLNFLELLRAGHFDYVINAEALAYRPSRPEAAILANWKNVVGTWSAGLTWEAAIHDIALHFEERGDEYGYFELGFSRPMEPELRRH